MGRRDKRDHWDTVSIGVFLIILGAVFLTTPNLIQEIMDFFRDLEIVDFQYGIGLIEPENPHPNLYRAIAIFAAASGTWNVILGVLRLNAPESRRRVIGSLSGAIFNFGAALTFIGLMNQTILFRTIIPILIILGGLSLIIRASVNLALNKRRQA